MIRLALLGCYHVNRRRYTAEDLDRVCGDGEHVDGDPDAFAVEYPRFDSPRDWLVAVLYSPIVTIGAGILGLFFQLPLFALTARDVLPTELSVLLDRDETRPIHLVDRHPLAVLRERSPLWALGNWATVIALAWLAPVATATVATVGILGMLPSTVRMLSGRRWLALATLAGSFAVGVAALWIVDWSWAIAAAAAIVVLVVIAATAHDRNRTMLDATRRVADEEGYDEICVITGRAHLPGMSEIAEEYGLTIDRSLAQEFFDRGRFVDPQHLETDAGTMNLGVDPEPDRTERVLRRRALAAGIDTPIVAVLSAVWLVVLTVPAALASEQLGENSSAVLALVLIAAIGWFLVPGGYFVFQELRYGQTLGHRIAGVEVISVDGEELDRKQAMLRTAGRIVDFLPVGYLLGFLVAWSGDGSRRFGDLRTGTAVVNAESE